MDKKLMRAMIDEIIDNQIANNDPPETQKTLSRLIQEGWSKGDARKLIGQCVFVEIFRIIKYKETFNLQRYLKNLNNLPAEPFEKA